jgi:hypothetical protein
MYSDLGTALPSAYVALMELYGAGYWSGWLHFCSPLRTGEKRYIHQAEKVMDGYRQLSSGTAGRRSTRSPPGQGPAVSFPSRAAPTATCSGGSPKAMTPASGP